MCFGKNSKTFQNSPKQFILTHLDFFTFGHYTKNCVSLIFYRPTNPKKSENTIFGSENHLKSPIIFGKSQSMFFIVLVQKRY